jgi:hypothetical protein
MLSLQGDSAVEFENKVVAVMWPVGLSLREATSRRLYALLS